ncbi:serine/arginine repetitive matrix protein 2-like [Tripterygium wilfordii]|uniref:Serine/arginine repetitive matrix protein 2-like n=1 Tax=Tripterygium wilfordii TaxID=458696 RepID=A0A7J7DAQ7_TRIWF|nr:uncharacterized protein LOC120005154 [Tripterygium wilfordii]KAF5743156.1 serine/arginine repetitive matrix protein 2-like [Tripterygium wilfordii]
MSIALDSSNRRIDIEASGLARGGVACVPATAVFDSMHERREVAETEACSSSSTSSIWQNRDLSGRSGSDGEDGEDNEVQSKYKGTLDSMEALEEVLPIRRGISNFYSGKSKSFASLAEAASNSVKDIAKAENAYTRRRRNLLCFNHIWDKNRNRNCSHRNGGGGISKRPISTSRSTLAMAMALSSSESISNTSDDSNSRSPPRLPALHPPLTRASYNNLASPLPSPRQKFSPGRSYSLADLQQSTTPTTNTNSYCSSASEERQ